MRLELDSNMNSLPLVKCYHLNGNKPSGSITKATSRTTSKAGTVFVALANLTNKDTIIKYYGELKRSEKALLLTFRVNRHAVEQNCYFSATVCIRHLALQQNLLKPES